VYVPTPVKTIFIIKKHILVKKGGLYMFAAVVPARNEEKNIKKVIKTLLKVPVDLIIPVINGCTDNSYQTVLSLNYKQVTPLIFNQPLGIDVPRAVGAKIAYNLGASGVLFVDGDMKGDIIANLRELKTKIEKNETDMALTNCYPTARIPISALANRLLKIREQLNKTINLFNKIGTANPAHGPHAVSRRLLASVPFKEFAIPPVTLALAAKEGFIVSTATAVPHPFLGSSRRDFVHAYRIAETIIGDCLEAMCVYKNKKRSRTKDGIKHLGYHLERRLKILE